MISIGTGQEMKVSVKSVGTDGSKSRTIRYINPLGAYTTEQNVTSLVKAFMKNSQDSYVSTSGSIEMGVLEESD